MSDDFVHLHNHTEYSLLDGASKVDALFVEAAHLGQSAVAVSDHGNGHAWYEAYQAGLRHGVKAVLGTEAYLAPRVERQHKKPVKWGGPGAAKGDDVSGNGAYTHMTMWAATRQGLLNLTAQQTIANIDGYYYKPRVDRDLLTRFNGGIIATTGCPSGEVQTFLRLGQYDNARAAAAEFADIFGAGNFFVEVMDHGLSIERRVREDLLRLSKDLGLPLVATNDSHYVRAEDAATQDALLAINSGSTLSDPDRFKFDGEGYFLKSAAQMAQVWGDLPEAMSNTLVIAERCEAGYEDSMGKYMPRFKVPDGESQDSWLIAEVTRGMARRYPNGVPARQQAQADFEIGVISSMGFSGYFLVVADFCAWARRQGIRVGPGRGSGAGSIAAYALGITDLDPIVHGLIFERFLNPDRVSMPDFDIDFDERRRGEVIDYVVATYGKECTAYLGTFTNLKAKAAVKDAARIHGYPFGIADKINKVMPKDIMGKGVPLAKMWDVDHERYAEGADFRALYDADTDVRTIVDAAKAVEGLKRGTGVHAAGIIISAEPIMNVLPLQMRQDDGAMITQFEYPTCEALGLIKFDFLGLRNLTILDDARALILANRGVDVVLEDLPLDDPKTYALLGRGETSGVFQFEGGGMRSLLRQMRPDNFEDISAVGALYRPGPMGAGSHTAYAERKNGRAPLTPIHPELAEPLADILGDTFGLIVYQEQVMAIAQKVAGYTLGQADLLRRAMGKKKKSELDKQFATFSAGMAERGYSTEAVQTLWDILLPFSDYAFNKAHSAAYGVISYWTAYLKAHYPAEYMAAVLTSVRDDKTKTAVFLSECRRMGITVHVPDVNESLATYAAVGDSIRVGMTAVRGVGSSVVDAIVRARTTQGAFTDFGDYLAKVEAVACNKKAVEALAKAGAFDSLGHSRRALVSVHEAAIDAAMSTKKAQANGQEDLFASLMGGGDEEDLAGVVVRVPDLEEWSKRALLTFERDMLGLYVSDHPLSDMAAALASQADTAITALMLAEPGEFTGRTVRLGGLVTSLERKVTKMGASWAKWTLEDLDGSIEVLCFPKTYEQASHLIAADAVLLVTARIDANEDGSAKVIVSDVQAAQIAEDGTRPLVVNLPAARVTPQVLAGLREVLSLHPGEATVQVRLASEAGALTLTLDGSLRVKTGGDGLLGDLKALLGASALA